jgi:ubiquinone/menaquinone biosynthesis C-methylase UbiE
MRYEGRSEGEVEEMHAEVAAFRDNVLDNAHLRAGDTVVDVGAGLGLLTLAAAERVAPDGEVLAVDISVDALEELRRVATASNISYLVGSADVLPLPDASVDVVMTRSVLIYVEDKAEAAREFFRVLRDGGRVSIFEPINRRNSRLSEAVDFGDFRERVREWEQRKYGNPADPMLNFDERDLERAFRDAGFRDVNGELRCGEWELAAEQVLTVVGAPGRLSLFDDWTQEFGADQAGRLAAAVRTAGSVRGRWSQLYLTARRSG